MFKLEREERWVKIGFPFHLLNMSISPQLILSRIAERVLDLPKSY